MKTTPVKCALAAVVLLSTLNPQLSTVLAQGSLTPPGAPAPTMKTLDQIEPRTPISAAPFTINVPGSYYLTANLTVATGDAITIATNGVTLDLSGFTIASTAPSATGYAIKLNGGLRNLTIVNGFIQGGVTNNGSGTYSGPGFGYGISYSGSEPGNTRVSGLSVSGCLYEGIGLWARGGALVESCTVRTVGGYGISAYIVRSCVATDCGSGAVAGEQVFDSRGESSVGLGLRAVWTAQNCYGITGSGEEGLMAYTAVNCFGESSNRFGLNAWVALNCVGLSRTGDGYALWADTAQNCQGLQYGSGTGVSAGTAQNCYGYNSGNGYGLAANNAQNCQGFCSGSGYGLTADLAHNCYGYSASGTGLSAFNTAQNCYGRSDAGGTGLSAFQGPALNCIGTSSSGTGLFARIATACQGHSSTGPGLSATLANSCLGYGYPAVSATNKYDMP